MSIFDLIAMTGLSEVEGNDRHQLFSLLKEHVVAAKETSYESISAALWEGGVGNNTPDDQKALAMDGLRQLMDRTKTYGTIAPADFGTYDADDVWFNMIAAGDLGQTSQNLHEPRVFREGDANAQITFDLVNPIIQKTRRFGGNRFSGIHPDLYATLENSVRDQVNLRPNAAAGQFQIPSFTLGDTTIMPDLRADANEMWIINPRYTKLKFGLPNGESSKRITVMEGSVDFPVYFGAWMQASEQEAAANGVYADVQLYNDNRASLTSILNLIP